MVVIQIMDMQVEHDGGGMPFETINSKILFLRVYIATYPGSGTYGIGYGYGTGSVVGWLIPW